jgi:hypothetical protein
MPDKQFNRPSSGGPQQRASRFGQAPATDVYAELQYGPQHTRSFEQQTGIPVDGSKSFLRQLSPFTIGMLPPLALSNVPDRAEEDLRRAIQTIALDAENLVNRFLDKIWVPQVGVTEEDQPVLAETDLTPHFTFNNFLKGHRIDPDFEGAGVEQVRSNLRALAEQLEIAKGVFEEISGGPVTIQIISGYRPSSKNNKEGQAENSQHLYGKAADITVSGFSVEAVTAVMNQLMNSGTITQGGLGFYPEDGFTHYDIRGKRQRWTEKVIPDSFEVKSIGQAVKMLPDGPLPSELARVEGDAGYNVPLQRRAVPSAPPPYVPLFDGASTVNTWQEALNSQARADLHLQGSSIGGLGSNRAQAEVYIAGGLAQTTENGAFTEPGIADRLVAVDIASQLDVIRKVPPLTLLINPASLSISYTKVQQFSQRTRNGFLYQGWGEEQPTITINGSIGAFTAGATSADAGSTPTGVQFASKRNSASYQNLMTLLGFYKNAGYIYDTVHKSNAHHMVGALVIEYDQWVYIGHMNSFNWGHEQDLPNGKLTFDIEFKVSQMFDNHVPLSAMMPLHSPTESPGSRAYTAGGVQPLVDVTGGGTSTFSFEDTGRPENTTSPLTGDEQVAPEGESGGGLRGTGLETNDDRAWFQSTNPETGEADEDFPFCVVVDIPNVGNVDLGCYATLEEAQQTLAEYRALEEVEFDFSDDDDENTFDFSDDA